MFFKRGVLDPLEIDGLGTDGLAHLGRITSTMITVGLEKVEQVRTILGHRLLHFLKRVIPMPWASNATHWKRPSFQIQRDVCSATQFVRSSLV